MTKTRKTTQMVLVLMAENFKGIIMHRERDETTIPLRVIDQRSHEKKNTLELIMVLQPTSIIREKR